MRPPAARESGELFGQPFAIFVAGPLALAARAVEQL
jgi:hypothetical protein